MKGYYFITDRNLSRLGNAHDVQSAVRAGVKIVQYREKNLGTGKIYLEALKLRKICKDIIFLINDRVDIAQAVDADGVHLGQDDLPYLTARKLLGKKKIIGVTVHSLKEAKLAQKQGADYIGLAPIFKTSTKPDAKDPVGMKAIKEIKKHIHLPLVVIGGINLSNAWEVISSGADCICAISAVVTSKNVKGRIQEFQKCFKLEMGYQAA
ncbi:MAG: thiamine phosphate synthase [Candidatus Omnitrophica bacterium]|jgi:thiamine-phosphate pyrophosphorylase|nr:thiamine phosphate synthase [Candidatus Omnitrophota bacterium]